RAMFAKNFFEAGGVEAVMHGEGDLVTGFKASGAQLACLCSSDALYAAQAVDAARALVAAGATLYLAGRPGELEATLHTAGVGRFIYAGCDVVASLNALLNVLTT